MSTKFENYLASVISEESEKLILRYHAYHNALHIEHCRNKKRIANAPPKVIERPDYWARDPKFNPFYVKSNRKSIARSITRKLATKSFVPNDPYVKQIPKKDGGHREVAIYQIPDAAISRIFYERLLEKNKHRFSSFSYAYRRDRNVHFAIQDIWLDVSRDTRAFIAEFDFSDFFGSISHGYLRTQFDCNGFYISNEERAVIDAFLKERDVGIPQGTSISLFLANLVCWRLDQAFERAGLKFARYADDTVVWSRSYQSICRAFTIINEFSSETGIQINPKKSDGISLLTRPGFPAELANTKSSLDFLGYSISVDAVSMKQASVEKVKKQISYLLYRNLIQPLRGPKPPGLIIPSKGEDAALITAMLQIRSYLYGGLTAQQLRNYISRRTKRISFKGIMSFYPLVNDQEQLRGLDGWLVSTIYRAIQLRGKTLNLSNQFPFNVAKFELAERLKSKRIRRGYPLEIPSFMLIHRALAEGLKGRGIAGVMNPDANEYNY
jgi:RNA-directed DNA polymerase